MKTESVSTLAWHASNGLSYLHKKIVRAAFEARRRDEQTTRRGCDILTSDLVKLMAHAKNGRSAQASVCRACAALERRGAVVRVKGITKWAGVALTPVGEYMARDWEARDREFVNRCPVPR